MNHSKKFEMWKSYYDLGMISKDKLHHLVGRKLGITEAEYKEITGEDYVA